MPNIRYYANGMRITEDEYKNLIETLEMYWIEHDVQTYPTYPGSLSKEIRVDFKESKEINLKSFIKKKDDSSIKPKHYRKGEIDLIESWYLLYPMNEFRAIMSSHIDKYKYRMKENREEDLEKCAYFTKRLQEYELREREKDNE